MVAAIPLVAFAFIMVVTLPKVRIRIRRRAAKTSDPERLKRLRAAWESLPPFRPPLPVTFSTGSSLEELKLRCPCCERLIPESGIRGTLSQIGKDIWHLDAVAVCRGCRCFVAFANRFRTDPDDPGGTILCEGFDTDGTVMITRTEKSSILGDAPKWLIDHLFRAIRRTLPPERPDL